MSLHPSMLGVDAGGTRTVALLVSGDGQLLRRKEWGPGNLRLLNDRELLFHFRRIADEFPAPSAVGVGMAGARLPKDCARVTAVLHRLWRGIPHRVAHDLETAWWAAEPIQGSRPLTLPSPPMGARVVVLSGTGSCCYGKTFGGRSAKVGGWGQLLGDRGSGYSIGLNGLKAIIEALDRRRNWTALGARFLRALQCNSPEEFIDRVKSAEKAQIAELAVEVFAAWAKGDPIARAVVAAAANDLVEDATACARRFAPISRVEFRLAGGVLSKQPRFAGLVARRLRKCWPNSSVGPLQRESAWGAIELARQALASASRPRTQRISTRNSTARVVTNFIPETKGVSPTEQSNPKSAKLDQLPLNRAVQLMAAEETKVAQAVTHAAPQIVAAVDLIAKAFCRNGRLIYVGAGTSGRLGVLDASECPPTFGVSPELVQGVIAGGTTALWRSIEGAEDNFEAGIEALRMRGVTSRDVVVGISASGRASFVWGALREARRVKAKRVLICCNPQLIFPRREKPDAVIALEVGPEVLTGSSRLKAGTATKVVLNMLTTLAMVRIGRVTGNLMIDLKATNAKLKRRAISILAKLSGITTAEAEALLRRHGWSVRKAIRSHGMASNQPVSPK